MYRHLQNIWRTVGILDIWVCITDTSCLNILPAVNM